MHLKADNRARITVVNSPLFRDKNPRYDEDSLPPIGLGIIATELEDHGYDVNLIDAVANNIPLRDLIDEVERINPEFICINVFTTNLILVKEFVESIKVETHFIVGGLSVKDLQNEIFSWETNFPIDLVYGDGEKIVLAIVLDDVLQTPNKSLKNKRFFQVDINSIYYVKDISLDRLNRNFFSNEPIIHPLGFKEATIVTSRGCIYNCAFCAAAQSVNRIQGTREKSVHSVITEIHHLIGIYPGLESIRVLDDLFLKSPNSIDKAIQIFSGFDLQWRAMAHVETFRNVDENTIQKLKKSGCKELFLGLESGSPKILKKIHKTSDITKIKQNVELLLRNGINVKGYFIYGFPDENKDDFDMTYDLALYLRNKSVEYGTIFRTSVFQYRPYHGTELYHAIIEDRIDAVNKIQSMEPNNQLSEMVNRLQFNFHNGNYSTEELNLVHEYILKTTKLNSLRIFGHDGSDNKCSQ